ncbi:MAG: 5'/3'-nucleotidase SurE [Kiritimatiellae bacterium]|nr:5'/3'-nucleotidase SurE [Kiritimatiellia bacterium]
MADILVTNDDGIESPGLRAAVEAVLSLGSVIVVAPSCQQTSTGRSFRGDKNSFLQPVKFPVNGTGVRAYHCECTPARAVLHAFDVLFSRKKPDLVVSGINYGENLGTNSTISGTIGAALQAATHGVRGLAVSLQTEIENHRKHVALEWSVARHFCREFARLMLERTLPADVDVLNVNVPASAKVNTPWTVARLSRQGYFSNLITAPTPASKIGDAVCRYGFDAATLEPDSDILAVCNGLVSVTPVSMDLTSRVDLKSFLKDVKLNA